MVQEILKYGQVILENEGSTQINLTPPSLVPLQLINKYESQRERISYLNESVNELLSVKLERDELASEKKQLEDANKRYHEHTSELQERVERLLVSHTHIVELHRGSTYT